VCFFQDAEGRAPVREWLRELQRSDPRAHADCVARIERLSELGHELRRPEADFVRDGHLELRARRGRVNYRVLYLFHGRNRAVLVEAFTKEGGIPRVHLQRAFHRRAAYLQDPLTHTHRD